MSRLYPLLRPFLSMVPPEAAHRLTILALRAGAGQLVPRPAHDARLRTQILGLEFPNPVGLAAGFDKNAEVPDAILSLGFGFAEVGTITPRPQGGNPRPRLFRLGPERAVINRMGFNNAGMDAAARRLARRDARPVVGINVGANKDSNDRIADYAEAISRLAPYADYLVVNVSSPNTPGLRALQSRSSLETLITGAKDALAAATKAADRKTSPPLLLKLSPDLLSEERAEIAAVARDMEIAGLIISNTTISRPGTLPARWKDEAGGLSGAPLFDLSTEALGDFYRLTEGRIPLIGVGGISTGEQAYRKIRQGASLVQLYTALVFEGPGLVRRICRDLVSCLNADGFATIGEAVGADYRQ